MRKSLLFITIAAAAQMTACVPSGPDGEPDEADVAGAPGEESVSEAASDLSPAKVIPLRFIHLLAATSCTPAAPCAGNAVTREIRAAVDKANEVYEPAGIKLWIKSEERVASPALASINASYLWTTVKDELRALYPNMPSDAYYNTDFKNSRYWARAAATLYGNDDEIVVYVWPGAGNWDGAFPESGRSIRTTGGNFALPLISDSTLKAASTALAHELGHYFGLRHTFEAPWGTNPLTNTSWTEVDRYDEILCLNPLSIPQTPAAADACNQFTMLDPFCTTSPAGSGQPTCVTPAGTYSAGSSTIDGLFRQIPGVTHSPPTSYAYAANIMGYRLPANWNLDEAAPAFVTDAQIAIMDSYLTFPAASPDILGFLRYDGTFPNGAITGAGLNRRNLLGSGTDDFISFSPGDAHTGGRFSFATYPKPISGTNYQPISADFDGDDNDDILWYDPASTMGRFWWGRDDRGFDHEDRPNFFSETGYTVFPGDFDGDGDVDLFLYKPGAGQDRIKINLYSGVFGGSSVDVLKTVSGTFTPLVGDFNGSGGDDIYWYSAANGTVNRWFAIGSHNFQSFDNVPVPTAGAIPFAGNFDGNGADDVFWYLPGGSATEKIWYGPQSGTTATTTTTSNVTGTYEPLAGDFDGDGRTDILWDAKNSRNDAIWGGKADKTFDKGSSDLNDATVTHSGKASFYGAFDPVAGDFDGDGSADVMWYRE